ncbi:MAG: TniQ family protein [Roseburia lenta]|nr:TniQ family protein [Roseburia lenta]
MLPIQFPPKEDEMPISWMQRIALSNGFDDLREMLYMSYIIAKQYAFPSFVHWKDVAKMFIHQDWMQSYQRKIEKSSLLIDDMQTKNIHVCPLCMKEEWERDGQFYYHMQHQYIGTYTCWRHRCNLATIAPASYLNLEEKIELYPITGIYDPEKEKQISLLFDHPDKFFEEMVRYRIWLLMQQAGKTLHEIKNPSDIPLNKDHMDRFDDVPDLLFGLIKGKYVQIKDEAMRTYILKCLFEGYHSYIHVINRLEDRQKTSYVDLYDTLVIKERKCAACSPKQTNTN